MNTLNNKTGIMLLIFGMYCVIMGIGMYLMRTVFGYNYSDADMTRVIFWVELILTLLLVFFVKRHFRWHEIGFARLQKKYLWWLLIPAAFIAFYSITFFIAIEADFSHYNWSLFGIILITTALVGFNEELMFRGIALQTLRARFSTRNAVILSAILFSLLHAVNYLGGMTLNATLGQLGFTFVFGLFYGWLAVKLNNIIPLMIAHFLWDLILFAGQV